MRRTFLRRLEATLYFSLIRSRAVKYLINFAKCWLGFRILKKDLLPQHSLFSPVATPSLYPHRCPKWVTSQTVGALRQDLPRAGNVTDLWYISIIMTEISLSTTMYFQMIANHHYMLYKLQCIVTVTCVASGFLVIFCRVRSHTRTLSSLQLPPPPPPHMRTSSGYSKKGQVTNQWNSTR